MARLAKSFGINFVMPMLASAGSADRFKYYRQADAVKAGLARDERQHAAVLRSLATQTAPNSAVGPDIAAAEGWHRSASGNDLRAAVLGANDGLVSNFC